MSDDAVTLELLGARLMGLTADVRDPQYNPAADAKVWDAQSGQHVRDLHVGGYCAVRFSPDSKWLLTSNGEVRIWRTGTWQEGKRHGQGTLTYPNGDTYVGAWQDDKRDGQGTYTVHDGQQYIGAWQDDKPYGKGAWVFPDGKQYVGEWRDEKPSGRGTWILPDGTQYRGEWKAAPVAQVSGQ